MLYVLVTAGILIAWSSLSVIAGERSRLEEAAREAAARKSKKHSAAMLGVDVVEEPHK